MAKGGELVDLPMKLLMPSSFDNKKEIAFKTIPSASKVGIKKVLESMYGFEVEKVRTLNMQGKKKRRGGRLVARPNYKKAYVTLKSPLPIASDIYPAQQIEKDRTCFNKHSKSSDSQENDMTNHWLDNEKEPSFIPEKQPCREGSGNFFTIGTMG